LDRERPTFPLHFCRACGQEYYGVAIGREGTLAPCELAPFDLDGTPAYICPEPHDPGTLPLPDNWLTKTGNVRKKYRDAVP
jgi:hypothetical protein